MFVPCYKRPVLLNWIVTENWWKPYSQLIIFTLKIFLLGIHWFFQSSPNSSVLVYFDFRDLSSGLSSQFSNMTDIICQNLGIRIIFTVFQWCPYCYSQGGSLTATCHDSYLIKFFTELKSIVKKSKTNTWNSFWEKNTVSWKNQCSGSYLKQKGKFLSAKAEEI